MAECRLSITKTPEEWIIIEQRIGNRELSLYIRSESARLKRIYLDNPDAFVISTNRSERKQPRIDIATQEDLEFLAFHLQKPTDQIVNELIILPLLLPKT